MTDSPATPRTDLASARGRSAGNNAKRRLNTSNFRLAALLILAITGLGCHREEKVAAPAPKFNVQPFNFQISSGSDQYQIEGAIARLPGTDRRPALLVLNGDTGNARDCVIHNGAFVIMGLDVACISLPGYGKSSGPSRFVGPPSVDAARQGLELLTARPDVTPNRMAIWGMGDGAVAAGLLMDSDARPKTIILQSGAYDMLKLWPEAALRTKLSILRQVWPSKRVLKERSVVEHLPGKLDCTVLILHGERDRKVPVKQAEQLATALTKRGAHVQAYYFPDGSHELGALVDAPLRKFLQDNLLPPASAS